MIAISFANKNQLVSENKKSLIQKMCMNIYFK